MKALSKMAGFSDTLTEINSVRKKLSKVLEYQEEEASKRRSELFDEIEGLMHKEDEAGVIGGIIPVHPSNNDRERRRSMMMPMMRPVDFDHTKKGIKSHDFAGNYSAIFLGCSDRTKAGKSMDNWFKKVRTSPHTWKTFVMLRSVVHQQRRRHILDLTAQYTRRKVCPVIMTLLNR